MNKEEALQSWQGNQKVWSNINGCTVIGRIIDRIGPDFLFRPTDQWVYPGDFLLTPEEINLFLSEDRQIKPNIWQGLKKLISSFVFVKLL